MIETVRPMCGIVVSLDICKSTNIFEKIVEKGTKNKNSDGFELYQVVDKIYKAIEWSVSGFSGEIIRFTGDGALIFFEESMGMSSTELALEFSISFSNLWKKCKECFDMLREINFRICLDKGQVMSNPDGGLWSGLVLNRASKMRHMEGEEKFFNRVTISKDVLDSISEKSIYHNLFNETGQCKIGDIQMKLYNISFEFEEKGNENEVQKAYSIPCGICLNGIDTSFSRIASVLGSVKNQTILPKRVILATTGSNIEKIKKNYTFPFETVFISEESLCNINRSSVRNILMKKMLDFNDCEMLCFLDGDTVISPLCLSIANNLFQSNPDCIFSTPRIDFDFTLSDTEIEKIVKLFLEKKGEFYVSNGLNYWGNRNVKSIDTTYNYKEKFLGSYLLFVPLTIILENGMWDENFVGWGEEDIDYTYRMSLKGYRLLTPKIEGFLSLHLTHDVGNDSSSMLKNARYLLSKYPDLYEYRMGFYALLGLV